MKKAGTILIYNCNDPKFSKMRQIFAMLRLLMRPVSPDKYDLPLKDLVAGTGEPSANPGEAFPENMLVFCGMSSALLHQVLDVLRLAGLPPIHFKAVLTETNQDWDSRQLYKELQEEKAAIEAAKSE